MITIGFSNIHDGYIVGTILLQKQVISFELDKDSIHSEDLEVVIHFNEDKESGQKEITFVDVGGDITTGRNVEEHVDHLDDLSTAIYEWFKSMLSNETQENRNQLSKQVYGKVENHIAEQNMEWANG